MTDSIASAARRAWTWLGGHDPGYLALRRAGRVAILMPANFAFTFKVIGNPVMATFAAFGSIAMLLLVDFRGELRDRIASQAALVVVGALLVSLATLASRSTVAAVLAMGVVAAVVIFAGVVSSVLAGATTSLLLGFILPVSLPGPVSSIPDRIAGWGLAGGVSVIAIAVLWPAPAADPLRAASATACRSLARGLRAGAGPDPDPDAASASGPESGGAVAAAGHEALVRLNQVFLATPFRPTGLTTAARATVRLVDELRFLARVVERSAAGYSSPAIGVIRTAAAAVLDNCAGLLERPDAPSEAFVRDRDALETVTRELPERIEVPRAARGDDPHRLETFVSELDPAFRAQEGSFMTAQIAGNVEVFAAASQRSWFARVLGRQPRDFTGRLISIHDRAGAHLSPRSTSLQNALRGGAALALAVLLARLIGVEHAFWVSFGTLSILRSNALSTGQTFARALIGTGIGFAVGAAIVLGIGTNTTVLWILLPFVVLFAGIAPAAISFTAGQAAFTIVLFILFNILAPAGWRIGLVRVEDVALGGGASLAIGLLFWPRGAGAAFGRALAEAYATAAAYLSRAVDVAVVCCAPGMPGVTASSGAASEATAAAAASRRLDDTFRTYLAERGPKRVGLPAATALVSGAAGLRIAADAILELWSGEPDPVQSRIGAARELDARADELQGWFERFERALVQGGALPEPQASTPDAEARLLETIDSDLRSSDGSATGAAVRVVWTGDHLDAIRRLQETLVEPLREVLSTGAVGAPPAQSWWAARVAITR